MLPILIFLSALIFAPTFQIYASNYYLTPAENIQLLKDSLRQDSFNAHYTFLLAENYRKADEKANALEWYQKRIAMKGDHEEVYQSKLEVGHILKEIGLPLNVVIEAYQSAFEFIPYRIEAIYYMAKTYNDHHIYADAFETLKLKNLIPPPKDSATPSSAKWIEDYGFTFEFSICTYYIEMHQESLAACDELLKNNSLPEEYRKITETNRQWPLAKLQALNQKS